MQEGYLCSIVFLCVVFASCTDIYQHQARKKSSSPNGYQALSLFSRAYALSRLNKKLLWAFLTLGVVHVGLGLVFIYDGTGRGELCFTSSAIVLSKVL